MTLSEVKKFIPLSSDRNYDKDDKYKSYAAVKTHLIAGAATTGLTLAGTYVLKNVLNSLEKDSYIYSSAAKKNSLISKLIAYITQPNVIKSLKKGLSQTLVLAPALYLISILKGIIIDKRRTAKLESFNYAKFELSEEELKERFKNVKHTSKTGAIYLKTNDGKELGSLLGAITSAALVTILSTKKPLKFIRNLTGGTAAGALSGFISGTFIDIWANSSVIKHADKTNFCQ